MEKIIIGQIVKEQGIKGDVKVIVFADKDFDLSCLKTVFVADSEAKVQRVYKVSGGYGLKLDIINSRNEAGSYKNLYISANKADIARKENRYFIVDLIGKKAVLNSGEQIGKIVDVQNFGSADVIYIKTNGKQVLVSHLEGLIESVDGENVVLNANKFNQGAVYED